MSDAALQRRESCAQGKGEVIFAIAPERLDKIKFKTERGQRHNTKLAGQCNRLNVCDASDFADVLWVKGVQVDGDKVRRAESAAVSNSIAVFLLHVRDQTGQVPHVYFDWTEGNPIVYLLRYLAFGEGYTDPITREVLRRAA